MSYLKKYGSAELNTSSMADIAFLLLTFFLMTTVIKNEKGLLLLLPPVIEEDSPIPLNERNLFNVQINSQDYFMVEGLRRPDLAGLRSEIKKFILNNGRDKTLSDSPKEAIVSLKADRGTSHKAYINALDEIQAAYYEIYAERVGMTAAKFRSLDQTNSTELAIYNKARQDIPMNISIAESSVVTRR
jgi:biopolymer transport protein ExbD